MKWQKWIATDNLGTMWKLTAHMKSPVITVHHWNPLKSSEQCLDGFLTNLEICYSFYTHFCSLTTQQQRRRQRIFCCSHPPSIASNKRHNKCSTIWHNRKIMIALKRNQHLCDGKILAMALNQANLESFNTMELERTNPSKISRCLLLDDKSFCVFWFKLE